MRAFGACPRPCGTTWATGATPVDFAKDPTLTTCAVAGTAEAASARSVHARPSERRARPRDLIAAARQETGDRKSLGSTWARMSVSRPRAALKLLITLGNRPSVATVPRIFGLGPGKTSELQSPHASAALVRGSPASTAGQGTF